MIFETHDLHKRFGEKRVLEGVDLRAESGRALGLLGRNGAGKTTTIRIIMGVFPADSGELKVDGANIERKRLRLGYLPEEHGLYPKLPIITQLVYIAELRGVRPSVSKKRIMSLLERLGASEYAPKRLETLSKGNQQKVQLAAALLADPEIVILDEPFSGLDPVNASLLKDLVKELIGEGKVVIFSSHQMNYVEEFCDEIAILHGGRIALAGGIGAIKRGYERNRIFIKSPDRDKIAGYCAESLGGAVTDCKEQKDGLLITLKSPAEKSQLISGLVSRFDIDSAGVYEPSLNDIFVQYTGDEQEAAKGGMSA